MSIQNTPLMKAMAGKMRYMDQRQTLLAQNIANADTPGYNSKDLTKVDFGAVLQSVTGSKKVHIETTNPAHMKGPNEIDNAKDQKDKAVYEVAPDGNGVIIEEQMVKANETTMDYNLMTNLTSKQVGMYRVALGRQQ
jgi:flagellar basal-body rod protein FlgB